MGVGIAGLNTNRSVASGQVELTVVGGGIEHKLDSQGVTVVVGIKKRVREVVSRIGSCELSERR